MSLYIGDISSIFDELLRVLEKVDTVDIRPYVRKLLDVVFSILHDRDKLRELALKLHDYSTMLLAECEYVDDRGRYVRYRVCDLLHILHQFVIGLTRDGVEDLDLEKELPSAAKAVLRGEFSSMSYLVFRCARKLLSLSRQDLESILDAVKSIEVRGEDPSSVFLRNCLDALSALIDVLREVKK